MDAILGNDRLNFKGYRLLTEYALPNKVPLDRDESGILNNHILFVAVEIFLLFSPSSLTRTELTESSCIAILFPLACTVRPRAIQALHSGALTLNFRWSVAGKPLYSKAWPLNFRGCCPGNHPK
jgi:hypothetical protein